MALSQTFLGVPPQTLTKLWGDAAFNNWYFAWSARKKAWCCSMQDEFIPTGIRMNRNMIESDARNDPSDARKMAGFLTRKMLMCFFFCERCFFFWGGGRFIDKRMSWENMRKPKKGERKRCSDIFFCLEIGWFYSRFLIGFYSRTSAYMIFFTWGWHKKSRKTTKKYQGIWGCFGETPIGAQPSLTPYKHFQKISCRRGVVQELGMDMLLCILEWTLSDDYPLVN